MLINISIINNNAVAGGGAMSLTVSGPILEDVVIENSFGEEKLKIWITKAWIDEVRISGVIENELGIEIPCNSWNPGPSSKVLYGAWWLTAGDMDFM